jgi:hypothetical protein
MELSKQDRIQNTLSVANLYFTPLYEEIAAATYILNSNKSYARDAEAQNQVLKGIGYFEYLACLLRQEYIDMDLCRELQLDEMISEFRRLLIKKSKKEKWVRDQLPYFKNLVNFRYKRT